MKPEIKKRWLAALRGGEYKQGRHALRVQGGKAFCCLGVLTDLYIKDHKSVKWNGEGIDNETGNLPDRVRKWAGLRINDPIVPRNKENNNSLAELNDGTGYGFKKIARLIEKHL